MKVVHAPALILAGALALATVACEKKPEVVEKPVPATSNLETSTLGTAIDGYVANSTSGQAALVDKAFAELDGEIAELDRRVADVTGAERTEAQAKADNLRSFRDKERLRYTEAQARAKTNEVKADTRDAGDRVEETARDAGEKVKDAAEAVKDSVENTVDKVRDKLD